MRRRVASSAVLGALAALLDAPCRVAAALRLFSMSVSSSSSSEGWFEWMTVMVNDVLAVASPSLTVMVIVAEPTFLRVGVSVTVRFAPKPPNLMLQAGTRVGLLDVAETIRPPGLLSMSPTVKAIGPVDEFFAIVRLAILLIVGASFTGMTLMLTVAAAESN